jgi:hypothetical protein
MSLAEVVIQYAIGCSFYNWMSLPATMTVFATIWSVETPFRLVLFQLLPSFLLMTVLRYHSVPLLDVSSVRAHFSSFHKKITNCRGRGSRCGRSSGHYRSEKKNHGAESSLWQRASGFSCGSWFSVEAKTLTLAPLKETLLRIPYSEQKTLPRKTINPQK